MLAVSGVQEYLGACLDSVLGQSSAGVEVIAVEDASPDACGAILDERAARDPRLKVIHLPASAGPGPARMRGLAEATGEYVWFVDPDDLLTDGALAAVAETVARCDPDVVLIDYLTVHVSGRAEPSPGAGLLAGPGRPPVTLAGRPALLERTMTSWSKVLRREYLAGLGVAFPAGIHEDVLVSCAALLGAGRIALLGRVCYLYRRRRASFLGTPGPGHFSIFASYEGVFAFMDDHPGLPGVTPTVRAATFVRAIEHYTTIFASGLVPRRRRREYFRRMHADFRRFRPPAYTAPAGLRGRKFTLIERGAYRRYLALSFLNRLRVALARAAGRGRGHGRAGGEPVPLPPVPPADHELIT